MNCTQCGKPLSPLICEACGAPISTTTCTACSNPAPSCSVCGHTAQAAAPVAQPTAPAAQPTAPAAQAAPPVQQAPAHYAPPPNQGYAPPPGAQPSGPVPPYGVPPHMAAPSYPYVPLVPTKKVPIGGWLLLFFVFTCIGLAYQAYSLILTLMASSISYFSLAITLIFSVLPTIMIIYYLSQRDIKFKYWFYFSAIVSFVHIAMGIVGVLAINTLTSQGNSSLIEDSLAATGLSDIALPENFITLVITFAMVILVIAALIQVLWLIYFNKSRRVAYTFNPHNNPPK